MIIWINGSFGAGKTTLSKKLIESIPNSVLFDPEQVGFIIHRTVPESKKIDFQSFKLWRSLVIDFINGLEKEFGKILIIPMALVVPEYQDEIFNALEASRRDFFHFYLDIEEQLLRSRISNQREMSAETNQWRLDQVERCLRAKSTMPKDTIFLNSGELRPEELVEQVKHYTQLL